MRSNMLQRATSKDVVRFDILFKWEIVMVNLGPPVIQFSKMMGESGTLPVKSMRVPRSELGSEDAMLSAMTPFLNCVPEAWRAEMTEELTSLARSLNGQLSHLGKPVSLVVEVRAKILSVVKCREGDGPLDHLFEKLTALAKADPYRTLSEPATLSSLEALEAVSADQFETDDRYKSQQYGNGGLAWEWRQCDLRNSSKDSGKAWKRWQCGLKKTRLVDRGQCRTGMELGGSAPLGKVGNVGAGGGVASSRWQAAELVPMLKKSSRPMMLLPEAI
ncbi:hypothetical protein CDL15_Pgr008177 [Punica granatum]|uniref:Uncharacterized protein n=1 Tax=Punica granatum TaxID=22663 RepID=A0A218VSV3_PUNGR|nr:hypothetical protein CDL15_Pgr008177 [Punica granatum]